MLINLTEPNELVEQLSSYEQLILWGGGALGKRIAQWLSDNACPFLCFVDQEEKAPILGKDVISTYELEKNYPEAVVIITSNVYFGEIENQLIDMGFSEEKILSYTLFCDSSVTWKDLDNNADWERMRKRVRRISELILPSADSVVDYGAGEMLLRELLSKTTEYYPIDYIQRSEETIMYDFNLGDYPEIETDVSILSGVLEFIKHADEMIDHVCKHTRKQIIISYITLEKYPNPEARRTSAYINDYTEGEVLNLFKNNGFQLTSKKADPSQTINTLYIFERLNGE